MIQKLKVSRGSLERSARALLGVSKVCFNARSRRCCAGVSKVFAQVSMLFQGAVFEGDRAGARLLALRWAAGPGSRTLKLQKMLKTKARSHLVEPCRPQLLSPPTIRFVSPLSSLPLASGRSSGALAPGGDGRCCRSNGPEGAGRC